MSYLHEIIWAQCRQTLENQKRLAELNAQLAEKTEVTNDK
jgi:hypothetical protein